MRALGKVVGMTRSGRLLVRAEEVPPLRVTVVNSDLTQLGQVVDIFGPAETPFVSVSIQATSTKVSPGQQVYFLTGKDRRLGRWRTSAT